MSDEEDKEYEVEDIVGEKEINGEIRYIVKWKGGAPETFEPLENLVNCQEILFRYLEAKSDKEKKKPSKSSSKYKPKVTVQKKEKTNTKKEKSVKNSLTKTSKSYFSSDLDYFSDSSSDSTKSDEKTKSKKEKSVKSSPKKNKEKFSFKEDSDSGDIFSDFNLSQDETINEDTKKGKEKEKDLKKKEKSTKINVESPKTKKSESKSSSKNKSESTSKSSSKDTSENNSKSTVNNSKNKSESKSKSPKKSTKKNESKSDTKKHTLDEDIPGENKYSLPFALYVVDDDATKKQVEKKKFNYSSRYGEEHQLVLNPFPIKEMKRVVYENNVQHIECVIPDRLEPDKIPVSILKILQPQMFDEFKAENKNDF